jgi:hypothetical protein
MEGSLSGVDAIPLPCCLDLARMDLASQCDVQCFVRMCRDLGLPRPNSIDPEVLTPPVYRPREDSNAERESERLFNASTNNTHLEDNPITATTPAPPLSPTLSATSSLFSSTGIDELGEAMAQMSVSMPERPSVNIGTQLHRIARLYYFIPGQVFNTW